MGLKQLEAEILRELRAVSEKKFLAREIMEWRTGELKAQDGEEVFYLPTLQIYVAVEKKDG